MKEFLKKNFVIILAFALPILLIAIVALLAYIPRSSTSTSTNFDFIYSFCEEKEYYYPYYCEDYLLDRYSVVNGRLVVNTINPEEYLEGLDLEEYLDTWDLEEKDIVDINKAYTTYLFLHDTKKNESREITLEEAQTLSLSDFSASPDGITVSDDYDEENGFLNDFFDFNDDYSYGYYLIKDKNKSKLNLANLDVYPDGFRFIGWVLPSNN